MEQYFLWIRFVSGAGTITVNGTMHDLLNRIMVLVDAGEEVEVTLNLLNGWTDPVTKLGGEPLSTNSSFSFTMPQSDVSLEITCSGSYIPVSPYGLKYYGTFKANYPNASCLDFKIYKDGYDGGTFPVHISSLRKSFGNIGDDILNTIVVSSLEFGLVGDGDEYFEFLEGDNRTWKVELKNGSNYLFNGFINPEELTKSFSKGKQIFNFTAKDGLDSLSSIRINKSILPGERAIDAIVGSLNQSFLELRDTKVFCNIWETRMDMGESVFEQFLTPDNTIWMDGEIAEYTDGVRIENETVYISDTIERLLRPFLCRVFIHNNEFYVLRTPDISKTINNGFSFDSNGENLGDATINSYYTIDCQLDRPQLSGRPIYSVFETKLKLGVLVEETAGSVYEANFELEEWRQVANTNAFTLKHWAYTRATPTGQPSSPPTGNTARIQYVSTGSTHDHGSEAVKIWTTTNTSGIADPNISYISLSSQFFGPKVNITEEVANKVAISFRFFLERVGSYNPKAEQYHSVGFSLRIGNSWLARDGETDFEWVNTETICRFQCTNSYVWNTVEIPPMLVPETGYLDFRLYQLMLAPGAEEDKYAVQYDTVKINISQNESLQLEELSVKAVTDAKYSRVHPVYETHIGDAVTNMSSSAIRLTDGNESVSVLWTRDGVEEVPLMANIGNELANLKGRKNLRTLADVHRLGIIPYEKVRVDDKYWMVVAFDTDYSVNKSRVDLCYLGEV